MYLNSIKIIIYVKRVDISIYKIFEDKEIINLYFIYNLLFLILRHLEIINYFSKY